MPESFLMTPPAPEMTPVESVVVPLPVPSSVRVWPLVVTFHVTFSAEVVLFLISILLSSVRLELTV